MQGQFLKLTRARIERGHVRFQSRGGGGGSEHLLKNHKNIRFLSHSWQDPLKEKSQSYQASIQCLAIISTPAKRHLNGVLLVSRW